RLDRFQFDLVPSTDKGPWKGSPGERLYVVGRPGGVRLASDPRLLVDMAEGRGKPWLRPESAARAHHHDLYLLVDASRLPGFVGSGELALGVSLDPPGVVHGEVYVSAPLDAVMRWIGQAEAIAKQSEAAKGKPKR